MSLYIGTVKTAILIFPFLALILSLPVLAFEYHHYGSMTIKRAIVLFAFVFYLLNAYFMVILPLPDPAVVAKLTTEKMQLIPFNVVRVFFVDSGFSLVHPHTWVQALRSFAFLQPAFNLLLTLPFGFFVRYYFRASMKHTIIASFCLSLFFELTQLSGLYFIYPRPYRLFDVDDLMLNTLGGLTGYYLTPIIAKILPNRDRMDQTSSQRALSVSWLRRFVAWMIDYGLVVNLLSFLLALGFKLIHLNSFATSPVVNYILPILIAVVGLPVLTNGTTIGKAIVRIKIANPNGTPATKMRILERQAFLYFFTLPIWNGWFNQANRLLTNEALRTERNYIIFALLSLFTVYFVFDLLATTITRRDLLFYDHLAHTKNINTLIK
ncbi:VanZ family protein [Paucilactobacillus nenjiangensis]|jgi:glycopeptide antibiotics resistance protein|uniref:VanZ family protein n=1 Tax=Paucilactobacillus nenjiangensis TaxID=1296540 RepID=UPI003BB6A62A